MDALIIDDDEAIRALLHSVLRKEGWRATLCQGPVEAVAHAKNGAFRVAFVDVHLGSADGIGLARRLRRLRPSLSVVLMSGSSTQEERARRCGLEPILLKPFSREAVCALLGACDGEREAD